MLQTSNIFCAFYGYLMRRTLHVTCKVIIL